MNEENKTGIFDSNNKEYKLYDIVYNPFFGDLWIVDYNKENEREDCKYRLILYNNEDDYYMDLDEPVGFKILASKGDKNYDELLKLMNDKKEEFKKEGI